jgi:DNA-binding CsgD family transcriptional regulator
VGPDLVTGPPARTTARLVGRAPLLAAVHQALDDARCVVVTGQDGMGKTAVLDAVAGSRSDELVLRAAGAEPERWIGGAVLTDLLAQVPADLRRGLDPARLHALGGDGTDLGARGRAWHDLLVACAAAHGRVLLVLDDAQFVDPTSADVLAFAVRRLLGSGVRVVLTWRWDGPPRPVPVVPEHSVLVEVPPLTADELAEVLESHGLSARAASRLHVESAGNPYLALALAGAFVDHGPAQRPPEPLPLPVVAMVRARLEQLPAGARETLLLAALANAPTLQLLERAGCADADRDLARAGELGLVVVEDRVVRFTPAAAAQLVALDAGAHRRGQVHTRLAGAVTCGAERDRHLALASVRPDGAVAGSLAQAAGVALRRGAHDLAAELYLLAAERSPAGADASADRVDWLVAAAQHGAQAGRAQVVHRAAEEALAGPATPRQRVQARLALVQLSSQGAAQMMTTLAAAAADAEGDPGAAALVRLWQALATLMGGSPALGLARADAARDLALQAGDTEVEALARSLGATASRHLGRGDHAERLDRALALPEPRLAGWGQFVPRVEAVRAAITEDRLDEALDDLHLLVARAERGVPEELVGLLGLLAQACARAGRCREAVLQAERTVRVGADAGLSPGPGWYCAAVAELAGGSLERAAAYAQQGARASEQEGDRNFLRCHLSVLGAAQLRLGRPEEAVATLLRVQAIEFEAGVRDPSDLRWRGDLVAALVAAGRVDDATHALERSRADVRSGGRGEGVSAQLDRSEALLELARGRAEQARALAVRSALAFARLGQPVEQGHSLLVQARAHAACGDPGTSAAMAALARELFVAHGAAPWVEQATLPGAPGAGADGGRPVLSGPARRLVAVAPPVAVPPEAPPERLPAGDGHPRPRPDADRTADRPLLAALTEVERRVAGLVADGASNREIAGRLFVSVKTVEATLTRVYRKLGVRSRTQLSRVLLAAGPVRVPATGPRPDPGRRPGPPRPTH